MRELFDICQKNTVFKIFWCFLSFEGGGGFSQKRCKIVCSDVSGTTWKSPEKMTIFPHLALFFHLSLPKMWQFHPL